MPFRVEYRPSTMAARLQRLARKMPEAVERALLGVATNARDDFNLTVATWQKPPKFRIEKDTKGYKVVVNSKQYKWVDEGTKAHYIAARRRAWLFFIGGGRAGSYHPKTQPNIIGSEYAYIDGEPVRVFAKEVWHPGTKPRNFTKVIGQKWSKKGTQAVRDAIKAITESEAMGL